MITDRLPWRPIADIPVAVEEAIIFDPDAAWLGGPHATSPVDDGRVARARRKADGSWWVDGEQGGYPVEPTHYVAITVPDGFPVQVDGQALFVERERQAAEREAARATAAAAEASRLEAQGGKSDFELECEAYWRDEVARMHAPAG